jgi:hypothetical protein
MNLSIYYIPKKEPFFRGFGLSFFIGFYVASTKYRPYGDFPALMVEENLRCPSVFQAKTST